MADGIRMMDFAVLTRSLDEFRRIDPEQRVLAERLATRAAVKHLEKVHEDVASAEPMTQTKVDEHSGGGGGRGSKGQHPHPEPPQEDEEATSVPERQEGLLLDIKA